VPFLGEEIVERKTGNNQFCGRFSGRLTRRRGRELGRDQKNSLLSYSPARGVALVGKKIALLPATAGNEWVEVPAPGRKEGFEE